MIRLHFLLMASSITSSVQSNVISAPRHFFLHSLDSLKTLVRKEKFYIKDIVFDSDEFQFWGSEQYKNDISLKSENSYSVSRTIDNYH